MQENQTLTNDVPTSASPSNETQKAGLSSLLKSKKAKIIGISLFVVVSLLLTSFLSLSKLKQKKPTPLSAPIPFPNSTQTSMDQLDPKCLLEPVPGPCKALTPGYYYDQQAGVCKQFIWGGCEGVKPFATLEDCSSTCESPTANWKTYTNNTLNFSFSYPNDWKMLDDNTLVSSDNLRMITSTTIDFTTVGITYCAAYPEDEPRCQTIKTGNLSIGIDWGDEKSNTANATISTSNNMGIILTLQPNPDNPNFASAAPLTFDEKSLFSQILSTFEFLPDDCQPCLQFTPPHPDFCQNGTKIPGEIDECGCQLPPTCI